MIVNPFDDYNAEQDEMEWGCRQPSQPRCKFCGSTDVRWRQQTGKWVLFSLQPGVEHKCLSQPDLDAFDVVPE